MTASAIIQYKQGSNVVDVGPTKPLPVSELGSVGIDHSANKPTLPNVGSNFAASGVYSSYYLIKTVAANSGRLNIEVQNTSGAQVVLVRDDGTAASGAQPANASVFALAGSASAGGDGSSWTSRSFKGRLQVYAPASTAQVAIYED